jgi:serine/threonine protein kinase/tetratricopeptide (TPR) repeat protein
MTPEQWAEVKERFHEALQQPAEVRQALLRRQCSSDLVRSEAERLLFEHGQSEGFLTLPALDSPRALALQPLDLREAFSNNSRFTIQERLGAGTFGVVYRVFDRDRNSVVALKKLLQFDPTHLLRFKREFRSLVDLVHPNLVQLYELFGDETQWFFTMELVQGTDFLSYVRPGGLEADWERLRDALYQLATGVQALHSSGRLHRDLKPPNVLVTTEGRLVILDFGLVREFESQSVEQSFALAGTPGYMSPEQAGGGSINEAADWYAVGVMMFKAITGQLPFAGAWPDTLDRKQRENAPSIKDLVPQVPDDLHEACRHLLERNPAARSAGVSILLGQGVHIKSAVRTQEEFVGRDTELNLLRERFAALSSGNRQMVLLEGQSGIGKTFLVSHFLSNLKRERPDAVILRGRCRESESVPYKALDAIADELVRYLKSISQPVAMALLPRHPELLKRLFPVFGELDILATFPDRPISDSEQQLIRRRAFEALCELLGRMTDRGPVVIAIDDLQWGDLDSIAFLAELVLPANAPALMLLLSFRTEEAESNPPLRALREFQHRLRDSDSWFEIEIQGLSERESRDLLDLLQTRTSAIRDDQLNDILRESGGSPLLLSELLRFVAREREANQEARPTGSILLSEMIRYRAATLTPTAKRLLEALSVAGEPLSKTTLYLTVKVTNDDPAREIWMLVHEHLVRVTGGAGEGKLEPFHDQVRQASLSWLSPEELQDWHAHLAQIFQREEPPDPQRLLRHYRGAGNLPAAFEAALAAAETAEKALAFEQAARFYSEAIETNEADDVTESNLKLKQAEALAKAGRGYESAQCYLRIADSPGQQDAIEMRRRAAEQLMRGGYLDEGIDLFADLLRSAGIHVPNARLESLIRMLVIRAYIRFRGLRWRERSEGEVPGVTLRKLDLLWSGAMALLSTDTIFGSYLQALHMLEALRAGEPFRLALSFGFAAIYESMGGTREFEHGRKLTNLAVQIAERLQDPYLSAMTELSWVGVDFLSGRVEDGMLHCQNAAAWLEKARSRATAWELGTLNMAQIWFLGWSGRIRELAAKVPLMMAEGRARGDVYAEVSVRCSGTAHLVELAADNPDRAISEINRALKQWRETFFDLPHFQAALARMECHLYAGRTEEARRHILADWRAIRRSLFTRKSQLQRTTLYYARGRTALAEWLRNRSENALRKEIEEYATRLENVHSPWGDALSRILRAGVAAGLKRRRETLALLEQAEQILRKQDLRLLAAAVARRRGELEESAGALRIEAADAFMHSEGIVRPDRITAMFLPGNWVL